MAIKIINLLLLFIIITLFSYYQLFPHKNEMYIIKNQSLAEKYEENLFSKSDIVILENEVLVNGEQRSIQSKLYNLSDDFYMLILFLDSKDKSSNKRNFYIFSHKNKDLLVNGVINDSHSPINTYKRNFISVTGNIFEFSDNVAIKYFCECQNIEMALNSNNVMGFSNEKFLYLTTKDEVYYFSKNDYYSSVENLLLGNEIKYNILTTHFSFIGLSKKMNLWSKMYPISGIKHYKENNKNGFIDFIYKVINNKLSISFEEVLYIGENKFLQKNIPLKFDIASKNNGKIISTRSVKNKKENILKIIKDSENINSVITYYFLDDKAIFANYSQYHDIVSGGINVEGICKYYFLRSSGKIGKVSIFSINLCK